ncbi:MAG: hypothetical protein ACYC33_07020 [Thermoleophilia bacterium]
MANAARGGMVLGAGYAIRQNDGAALADYGLSIENLRGLSPVRQCAAILDALLGQGAHPDEHALRKASMESLKEILQSEIPPPEADAVGGFVVNYVYELVLVELQAQLDAGAMNAAESARRERGIRHYLEHRVAQVKATITGRVKASDLRSLAARLTSEAIRIVRARPETS